jgi:hypothetical protein
MGNFFSIISGIPLFSGLSDNYLKEIERIAVEKKFQPG